MLIILLLVIGIGLLVCGVLLARKTDEDAWHFFTAFGFIFILVFSLWLIISPIFNADRLQEMIAFNESNVRAYSISVDRTTAILSSEKYVQNAVVPIEGSVEKMGVSTSISDRIKEWRDEVVRYNSDLRKYRYWNGSIWLGLLYPDVPDSMTYLAVE